MPQFVEVAAQEYLNVDGNERLAQTVHGLDIEVGGRIVGRIESYKVSPQTKTITPQRELTRKGYGRIVEQVPGKGNDTQTISIIRPELWASEMEIAFGYAAVFQDLTDQTRPFTLYERLYKGTVPYRVWGFFGCWFGSQDIGDFTVDGDSIIKKTAEIHYTARVKLL